MPFPFRSLILASVVLPAIALAHDNKPQPCGTVVRSIRLERDCAGPMVIARDNITVNLNGHTIQAVQLPNDEEGRGGVEIIGRRGVTLKNGTINGYRYGLLVEQGGGHTIRNLDVKVDLVPKPGVPENVPVVIIGVDHTLVTRITDRGLFFFDQGASSKISHVTSRSDTSTAAYISGETLTVSNNDFETGSGPEAYSGLFFRGQRSIIRQNRVTSFRTSVELGSLSISGTNNLVKSNTIFGSATGLFVFSGASGNVIRNNNISSDPAAVPDALDIRGGQYPCLNTWKNNNFQTDSEGDGPDEGCIR